jgi:hypothetical protein
MWDEFERTLDNEHDESIRIWDEFDKWKMQNQLIENI